jgi:cyclopropane fatty-acyl-phospholipid synthase-like methyltransferase
MENFQGGYNESRPKRIRIIVDHYGKDSFSGKSLLEVGAGYGHIGAEFASTYGSKVLCTDARPEYVSMIKQLHPQVEAAVQDLEQPWPHGEKFDFLLYMGVMHHVRADHVEKALMDMCNASDNIVLEHVVTDSEDPYLVIPLSEPAYDQSIHRMGSRPSAAYIERILMELEMKFEMVMDERLNGPAGFTWKPGYAPHIGPRRFWFVWR